jgi:hypothetical protein
MFFRCCLVTPLSPCRLFPQGGRTGQDGAGRGRCGLVRSGPRVRPLRPVRVPVVLVSLARGSTARVVLFCARGSTARVTGLRVRL